MKIDRPPEPARRVRDVRGVRRRGLRADSNRKSSTAVNRAGLKVREGVTAFFLASPASMSVRTRRGLVCPNPPRQAAG
ncbi:hypothetical protein RAS1_06800 [Phycisphaerae bacterium RAS1]|nr:hypothetical protein RAS1_06800 [Phycisphaerae bacterium RAS1]